MRYLSLFAGVGGFDLGADAAGWECAGQVEWDPWCQQVLNRHWPYVPKWADVRNFDGADLAVDAIVGGFPCQDVSVAGRRAGLGEGTRSGLYGEIIRIIGEMRHATDNEFPRWVILENVVGLLSIDGGRGFRAVLGDLADSGAHLVEWAVLDSQFFGVPQRRRRVFVVACFDPRTAERAPDPLLPVGPRLRRDSGESRAAGQEVAGTLGGGSGGRGWAPDTDRMTFVPTLTAKCGSTLDDQQAGQLVTAFHLTQDPISSTERTPSLTVGSSGGAAMLGVAYLGNGATNMPANMPGAVRRLTPRECERLQGWPDDHTRWTADGREIADSHRYRMAGNGISAPVARWVAQCVTAADTWPTGVPVAPKRTHHTTAPRCAGDAELPHTSRTAASEAEPSARPQGESDTVADLAHCVVGHGRREGVDVAGDGDGVVAAHLQDVVTHGGEVVLVQGLDRHVDESTTNPTRCQPQTGDAA